MSATNFDQAFRILIGHEGKFVNDPDDRGGATKYGVTQKTLSAWRGRPVSVDDVKNLELREAMDIFRQQYWDAVKADRLPSGVDFCVADMAYNSGPGKAAQVLQKALGIKVDGVVGAFTLDAAKKVNAVDLINRFCDARMAFLKTTYGWAKYKNGWTNRVADVRRKSILMSRTGVVADGSVTDVPVDRDSQKTSFLATSSGQSKVGVGVGLLGSQASDLADQIMPYADAFTYLKYAFLGLTGVAFLATVYLTIQRFKEEDGDA